MKVLTSEAQAELQSLVEELRFVDGLSIDQGAQLNYWSSELKPKRVRRKNGLNLNTEEGVIEQAYQEHIPLTQEATGNF